MKIGPILFSTSMVRALLAGRKTQTRRLESSPLARVAAGDRLYVREAFARRGDNADDGHLAPVYFRADTAPPGSFKWRTPLHLPRASSRLTLDVKAIERQRLQDIDAVDAQREGVTLSPTDGYWTVPDAPIPKGEDFTYYYACDPIETFAKFWDVLHGAGAWRSNPPIVAATFAIQRQNVDSVAA